MSKSWLAKFPDPSRRERSGTLGGLPEGVPSKTPAGSLGGHRGTLPGRHQGRARLLNNHRSCTSEGRGWQGVGSFCKEFVGFNTMPCCPMPLLVHFWNPSAKRRLGRPAWIAARMTKRGLSWRWHSSDTVCECSSRAVLQQKILLGRTSKSVNVHVAGCSISRFIKGGCSGNRV